MHFERAAVVAGARADPKNGKAAMWITASGQWACLLLYLWTLAAPRLMPDRDFS
jgi:Serine incorporator (Serinc)